MDGRFGDSNILGESQKKYHIPEKRLHLLTNAWQNMEEKSSEFECCMRLKPYGRCQEMEYVSILPQ
jgi:hypothetical protein